MMPEFWKLCKGEDGTLFPDWKKKKKKKAIAETKIPIVVLGVPCISLLSGLMKPCIDNGHLSDEQQTFNYRLSDSAELG